MVAPVIPSAASVEATVDCKKATRFPPDPGAKCERSNGCNRQFDLNPYHASLP